MRAFSLPSIGRESLDNDNLSLFPVQNRWTATTFPRLANGSLWQTTARSVHCNSGDAARSPGGEDHAQLCRLRKGTAASRRHVSHHLRQGFPPGRRPDLQPPPLHHQGSGGHRPHNRDQGQRWTSDGDGPSRASRRTCPALPRGAITLRRRPSTWTSGTHQSWAGPCSQAVP